MNFKETHINPMNAVVYTTPDGFGFNLHDVCMNPIETNFVLGKRMRIVVTTAKSDNGRWNFGHDFMYYSGEYHRPCSYVSSVDDGYASESKAILEALVCSESFFRYYIYENPDLIEAVMKRIRLLKRRYQERQLELF